MSRRIPGKHRAASARPRALPLTLALALGAAGACTAPEVTEPLNGTVEVVAPPEVPVTRPRAAMLWVAPASVAVLDDVEMVDGQATLTLRRPPFEMLETFRPVELIDFVASDGFRFATAEVIRPRLAMYDDLNGDGVFDLPPPYGDGSDTLLALDRGTEDGVAWLPDLEAVFAQTYLTFNDMLNTLLGGQHSPWVRVSGPGPLLAFDPQRPYFLQSGDEALLGAIMLCPRFEVQGIVKTDVKRLVDPQAPGRLKCDPDCRDPAFRAVPAEATSTTDQLPVREECQRGRALWAWRQRQEGVVCTGCVCEFIEYDVVAVTDAADPPAWWPCQGPPGGPGDPAGVPECERCALLCELDLCDDVIPPDSADGGVADAGVSDGGVSDGGVSDAGVADVGVSDAIVMDAAGADAGP